MTLDEIIKYLELIQTGLEDELSSEEKKALSCATTVIKKFNIKPNKIMLNSIYGKSVYNACTDTLKLF